MRNNRIVREALCKAASIIRVKALELDPNSYAFWDLIECTVKLTEQEIKYTREYYSIKVRS